MTGGEIFARAGNLVEQFVDLSTGVRLGYVERGDREGIPIVFLHGVTDSWRSFEPVLPQLPPTFRAFALSQRGHGESSRPEAGYGYADMAEDLRAFLDAMQLPSAVIVGHSMGSLVAQRFAANHPSRVSRLVLIGAFATLHQHPAVGEFIATTIAPLTDPIDPAVALDFQLSTLAREIPAAFLDTVVRESLKVPARVWQAAFEAFATTPDFGHELAAFTAPTLILWGEQDAFAQRTDQDKLLAAIPHARLVSYEGVGHAVHWEVPTRVAQDLADFVLEHRQMQ